MDVFAQLGLQALTGLTGLTGFTEAELLLRLVDLVLAVSLIELLWLLLRRPAAMAGLLANLMAGLSLALALRLGLSGAGLAWVAPCLMAAGLSHGLDLRARRRSPPVFPHTPLAGQKRPTP
jgi:hypothetical protein